MQQRRNCIFCGNPADSKEHLPSDWILKSLPAKRQLIQRISKGEIRKFSGPLTIKCVCAGCNNGWMSQLEASIRPILGSMMHDLSVYLDISAQRDLSTWSVKTAMALEGTKPQKAARCYSLPDCAALRLRSSIPSHTRVWIGRFSVSGLLAHGAEYSLHVGEHPVITHGCVATIIVGYLAIQILSPYSPAEYNDKVLSIPCRLGPWNELLIPIWPASGTVMWPPSLSFTNDNGPLSYLRLRDRWKPE